jgi:hypothetical protein
MKVAFLLLAHKEPAFVARLVRLLGRDGDEVFIHIDKTSDLAAFEREIKPLGKFVHFIAKRYPVEWAGFTMVQATNALIEAAVQRGGFDYFYLLSGQCLPLRPLSWLKQKLKEGKDYIDLVPMPQATKPMHRLHRRVVRSKRIGLRWRGRMLAEAMLNLLPVPDFEKTFHMAPFAGSQWWCLSRDTIEHIRNYVRGNPRYNRYMFFTHCSDEMYYHTIVANGPHRTRVAGSLTGAIWIEGKKNPEVMTRDSLKKLLAGSYFTARKFEPGNTALVNEVEKLATGEAATQPLA